MRQGNNYWKIWVVEITVVSHTICPDKINGSNSGKLQLLLPKIIYFYHDVSVFSWVFSSLYITGLHGFLHCSPLFFIISYSWYCSLLDFFTSVWVFLLVYCFFNWHQILCNVNTVILLLRNSFLFYHWICFNFSGQNLINFMHHKNNFQYYW